METVEILALVVGTITGFIALLHFQHDKGKKQQDVVVNFNPEIKVEPMYTAEEKAVSSKPVEPELPELNDEYYKELGLNVYRAKKSGDEFDINFIDD
ncbi:MAG: hypothetical protein GC178_18215 [Flavobacteriales bacterium]|nr:hypothetical protein [Flavobacteriales bacterium]